MTFERTRRLYNFECENGLQFASFKFSQLVVHIS